MKTLIWAIIKCIMIISTAVAGIVVYSVKIEPNRLVVNEFDFELVSGGEDSIRIVQFSDVHLGPNYSLKQLEKLVHKINKLRPDIITFTGDLMDIPSQFDDRSKISEILSKLNNTYGNYAVWGNHDYGGGGVRFYEDIMTASGFEILKNENGIIELENGKALNVVGVDDAMLGNPDIQMAFAGINSHLPTLLLLHEPDLVEEVAYDKVDLILAGHSHGGQVVLPGIGPLYTPPLAQKYEKGLYALEVGKHLYVNSGIGTTKIAIRFGNPPEISVFDVFL
ncbi:metallophosphoesterase [Psychrobacillus sp.]|uniref:metallophosphoesterase n=1 Tax=Psychrobacillus sp. TaxID=1871623 RepID=UPI0028BECAAB|nr:metallophosphoesterase [Psychrobacillus sp.]